MTGRGFLARVIAGCYFLIAIVAAFYIIYLFVGIMSEKLHAILLILLAPSIAIVIILIIVYRIFFRYSAGALVSLSGLLGVTAYYISSILLEDTFHKFSDASGPLYLLAGLSPILIGYFGYRLVRLYFSKEFELILGKDQNADN